MNIYIHKYIVLNAFVDWCANFFQNIVVCPESPKILPGVKAKIPVGDTLKGEVIGILVGSFFRKP